MTGGSEDRRPSRVLTRTTVTKPMIAITKHWQPREARFLGLIALTLLLIGLHLAEGLRIAGMEGSGHRVIDLKALELRIQTGDLTDHEAEWYHPARPEELRGGHP